MTGHDPIPLGALARIHIQDGPSASWPIVERVPGGWQSGAHHYPDAEVVSVERISADPVPAPPAGMTLARIEILLADIRDYAETGDPEAAHAREDHLHTEVLKAIAEHAPDPAALAAAALRSGQVEFPRPCA